MAAVRPYLSFKTEAREALEFYQSALGGSLEVSTFGEMPMPGMPASANGLVMHGALTIDEDLTIMAADSPEGMAPYEAPTSGVNVALVGYSTDHEYIASAFEALSQDAREVLPFEKAPWGDYYGQLRDKFGVSWMFDCGTPESEAAARER